MDFTESRLWPWVKCTFPSLRFLICEMVTLLVPREAPEAQGRARQAVLQKQQLSAALCRLVQRVPL